MIDWNKIEENCAGRILPDCVPSNIREWNRFAEQYENALKYFNGEGLDFTFEDMNMGQHGDLVLRHLYLGYGAKKSVFECLRDLYPVDKDLFEGLDWDKIRVVARIWLSWDIILDMRWSRSWGPPWFPRFVGGSVLWTRELKSLVGAPEYVGGNFNCSANNLKSLKGAPRRVIKDFVCSSNRLQSLAGSPEYVGGNFNCNNNMLTSLEGAPKDVHGYFLCSGNNLPKHVPDNFPGVMLDQHRGNSTILEFNQHKRLQYNKWLTSAESLGISSKTYQRKR